MKCAIKNMAGRMSRVLVMGLLVLLGWAGTMPVMAAEPVYIGTAEELKAFATTVNSGNPTLDGVLTADIVLQDTTGWENWLTTTPTSLAEWTPIGSRTNKYNGTFDGAGHTVSGIYINSAENDQGLFGVTTGTATIKNLGVIESSIKGENNVAGVVGETGSGEIINCYNAGTVTGNIYVGGVTSAGKVINCSNTGTVTGTAKYVGGVAGVGINQVINCYNTGSVTGTENVGGVAGWIVAGDTENCYNTGTVTGTVYVGGVVGAGASGGRTVNCHNIGDVIGEDYVGGVTGQSAGTTGNCYNAGSVSGEKYVGGVTGRGTKSIANCYNVGSVTGIYKVGGVAGESEEAVINCYNVGSVSGTSYVGGVAGSLNDSRTNCYYGELSAAKGIGNKEDAHGQTEAKPLNAFTSGEVTWLLQNGQTDQSDQVWGQDITGFEVDALPLLKATDQVCCVTFNAGNGFMPKTETYVNKDGHVTPPEPVAGYDWKDTNQVVLTAETAITKDTNVIYGIAQPTATATYGTKLGEITLVGSSVTAGAWNWEDQDKETVLAVGNTTAYWATYMPTDMVMFEIEQFLIIPAINPRSLADTGVTISQPDNASYTGAAIEPAVTVADTGAVITDSDYTVTYTNNINPGTATVTVTGQGNYQGTVTRTFTILSTGGGGTPSMSGITVNPGAITFDPAGQLAVAVTGAPAGAVIYYSQDGMTYTTTPPTITSAGEHTVWIKITCPGYQDYRTETTVTVAKQKAPVVPRIPVQMLSGELNQDCDLGTMLPGNRGNTQFTIGEIDDPGQILASSPAIDADGKIRFSFQSPAASLDQLEAAAVTAAKTATVTVQVTMENYEDTTLTLVVSEAESIGVRYLTHIQDIGWETDWVTDGALSGTSGQSKRLEALKVELTGDLPEGASIKTSVHVQNQGNLGPFAMGTAAGTSGQGLRLENISLTLENLPGYTLRYNVHVQNQGWLQDETDSSSWFQSGETAGTAGQGLRLEGIQIRLVKAE